MIEMNDIAEKIINVIREEIQSLQAGQKKYSEIHSLMEATLGVTLDDADGVSYMDKMTVLRQFIRTIEGMERRGEI
jgi:hypothetical protein